jgi:hypothetical protein
LPEFSIDVALPINQGAGMAWSNRYGNLCELVTGKIDGVPTDIFDWKWC